MMRHARLERPRIVFLGTCSASDGVIFGALRSGAIRDYDTIIIGGGLAGLTAALRLASESRRVLLLERRPYVGGRAASWHDDGMPVESALHRYLGFYTHLPALLERAGIDVDSILIWEDELEIRVPDGPCDVYGIAPLRKPMDTLRAAIDNDLISIARAVRKCGDAVETGAPVDRLLFDGGRVHGVTLQLELDRPATDVDRATFGPDLEGHITRYRVIRHPADFYRLTPGSEGLRPHQRTPVPGLLLAGDYTKQKCLATMEGAVVSGNIAADLILG